jgi:heme-degrading monooxygenase HmoA
MFANVFEYSVTPDNRADFDAQLAEFLAVLEPQPGFLGTMEVAIGEGRGAVVNLWDSQEAAQATRKVMAREYDRVLKLISVQPVASGEVTHNTISARA